MQKLSFTEMEETVGGKVSQCGFFTGFGGALAIGALAAVITIGTGGAGIGVAAALIGLSGASTIAAGTACISS
jgi:hypothetical protein